MVLVGASPAVTIAVIAEGRARGPLADLATEVVVFMEIAVVVLFAVSQSAVRAVFDAAAVPAIDLVGITLWALAGSIAFGAVCGALFTLYLQIVGREITVVLLVLCGVLTGFAAPLGIRAVSCRSVGRAGHSEHPARRRRRAP